MRGNPVRKQVLIIAVATFVIAVGVGLGYLLAQRDGGILTQGGRANMVVIGHDESGGTDALMVMSLSQVDLVLLSIPLDLRLKGPGDAFYRADEIYGTFGGEAVARSIAGLLGVEVPFYLAIGRGTMADWIGEAGGVTVTVDETVVYSNLSVDPPLRVEIRPGDQWLDDTEAVAFFTAPSEPEGGSLVTRQHAFLRAFLREGLQEPSPRSVRSTLRTLSPEFDTNLGWGDIYELSTTLRDFPPERVATEVLPGEKAVVDGATYTQPMIVATERIVASMIQGLDLLTPDEVKVAVFNGNGIRQMASRTADYLRARGFQITRIANAETFGYPASYVVVLTDEAKAWILSDALLSEVRIVSPETFEEHYVALQDFIPAGTDLVLIAGAGMVLE